LVEEFDMLRRENVNVDLSYSLAKEIINHNNYDKSKSLGGIGSLEFPQTLTQITGRDESEARNFFNRQLIMELGWEGYELYLEQSNQL
jgi:hypothetical protein